VHPGGDDRTEGADEGVAPAVASGDGEGDSTDAEGDADPVGALLTTGVVPHAVKIKRDPATAQLARCMLV
jgi:hypothetical protein